MSHTCHAEDCTTNCPPRMLMCRPCWRRVPRDLQQAVLNAYQPGQERLNPMPSEAWLNAAFRAVNAVAQAEGKPIPYPAMESTWWAAEPVTGSTRHPARSTPATRSAAENSR